MFLFDWQLRQYKRKSGTPWRRRRAHVGFRFIPKWRNQQCLYMVILEVMRHPWKDFREIIWRGGGVPLSSTAGCMSLNSVRSQSIKIITGIHSFSEKVIHASVKMKLMAVAWRGRCKRNQSVTPRLRFYATKEIKVTFCETKFKRTVYQRWNPYRS